MSQPATTYVASLARSAAWPWRVIGALTVLALIGAFGNAWDLFWHIVIGRDSFWIPPHTMMYAAVALSGLIALAVVLGNTLRRADALSAMVDRAICFWIPQLPETFSRGCCDPRLRPADAGDRTLHAAAQAYARQPP